MTTRLAAKKKADIDDDWEPGDEDLMGAEDEFQELAAIDLEDDLLEEEIDVVDDDLIAGTTDTTKMAADDEDEDEDLDLDLDEWDEYEDEEDEDEDIEEERVGVAAQAEEMDEDWADKEGEGDEEEEEEEEDLEDEYIPLQDDPNDPNYQALKTFVEETVERRDKVIADRDFDPVDFVINRMPPELADAFETLPFIQEVEKRAKEMILIDEDDVKDVDLEAELPDVPDLMDDDPYDNEGRANILGSGVSDDDLEKLDKAWKDAKKKLATPHWDKVREIGELYDFELYDKLDNQTKEEIEEAEEEIEGCSYNTTRFLLYELDFNVSNLILAAVKHNRQAPLIFMHWYPQLTVYERYQHVRDRDFDFNWDDVENADVSELERWYKGVGYDEIPSKLPSETGIISLEDLDEDEIKMGAFENWFLDVYNPVTDKLDFDDDDFRDEDNVFSPFHEPHEHPDIPTYAETLEDFEEWDEELYAEGEEVSRRDQEIYGRDRKYTYEEDPEFEKEFRGHLVVACTPMDEDLAVAEAITERMTKAFGKQVYTETRVMSLARDEDFVFEVWLESYEIDLLHSKKRATTGAAGWDGPAECDDKQIDYLVEKVRFLISDDARYSYRWEVDLPVS
jgi:hypothetical protein